MIKKSYYIVLKPVIEIRLEKYHLYWAVGSSLSTSNNVSMHTDAAAVRIVDAAVLQEVTAEVDLTYEGLRSAIATLAASL